MKSSFAGKVALITGGTAVLYLCSPQAAFITGVALPLDGGLAA
jgi:NAD(P)-dependent dehydrogenase (short-subunit alcohol dehydrogenase family)